MAVAGVGNGPHNFDLTIVSHVELIDLVKITEPDYYSGHKYASNVLYKQIVSTPDEAGRAKLLGDAQRDAGGLTGRRFSVPAAADHSLPGNTRKWEGRWNKSRIRERFLHLVLGGRTARSGWTCCLANGLFPPGRGHLFWVRMQNLKTTPLQETGCPLLQ